MSFFKDTYFDLLVVVINPMTTYGWGGCHTQVKYQLNKFA